MLRRRIRRFRSYRARPRPDHSAAAAPARRASLPARLVVSLVLVAAFSFLGGAGAPPASQASTLAEVNVSFAPMPFGSVTLTKADGTTTECLWNRGGDCNSAVTVGEDVTLTAALDPDPGSDPLLAGLNQRFYGWSTPACGTDPTCTLKQVSEDVQAFALFTPALFEVRVGGAGVVESEGSAIQLKCEVDQTKQDGCRRTLDAGTSFTLRASPTNPDDAVEWVFGCDPGNDPHASTCLTRSENRVVGVRFGAADAPDLPFNVTVKFRVTKGGSGAGSVSGESIDCGSVCTSTKDFGKRLQLTATPASGSRFDRWIGAPCSDAPTCTLNAGPVTAVRALFEPLPAPPAPPAPPTPPTPPAPPAPSPAPDPSPPTPGTLKLALQVVDVSAHRVGGRYRVVARLKVNKRVNARLTVARGSRVVGQRLVPLGAGRTKTSVGLAKGTRPGRAWLVLRVRDADGQIVTKTRRIQLGR